MDMLMHVRLWLYLHGFEISMFIGALGLVVVAWTFVLMRKDKKYEADKHRR